MGPRGGGNGGSVLWELWSLCVWWAAWSLADRYLLASSPVSEIAVLWICAIVAGIARLVSYIGRSARYPECIEAADPDHPSTKGGALDVSDVLE